MVPAYTNPPWGLGFKSTNNDYVTDALQAQY